MIAVPVIIAVIVLAVVVLRPLPTAAARPAQSEDVADRHRLLLRQLRDLDDDLAAGKIDEADHARLSAPVIRDAAAASRAGRDQGRRPTEPSAVAAPLGRPRRSGGTRRLAIVLVVAVGAAAVTALLANTITQRDPGQPLSGSAPAVPPPAGAGASTAPSAAPSAGAQPSLTTQQAEAIADALTDVKNHPRSLDAHLALAHAYAGAGASKLAAVEYLAITQLDPGNAEANTALALLAFEVGQVKQGAQLVDRALAAQPRYPEGLYVRGLIRLVGLHEPAPAASDLRTYLAVAPFGAHRTAAETLLALASGRGTP